MTDFPPPGDSPTSITIDEPEHMDAIPQLYYGTHMSNGDIVEQDDGTYETPFVLYRPINLAGVGAPTPDMTFPEYRPLGTLTATPRDDGRYDVELPDDEAYSDVLHEYLDRETDRRAGMLSKTLAEFSEIIENASADAKDATYEQAPLESRNLTVQEAFELGKEIGKLSVASPLKADIEATKDKHQFELPETN